MIDSERNSSHGLSDRRQLPLSSAPTKPDAERDPGELSPEEAEALIYAGLSGAEVREAAATQKELTRIYRKAFGIPAPQSLPGAPPDDEGLNLLKRYVYSPRELTTEQYGLVLQKLLSFESWREVRRALVREKYRERRSGSDRDPDQSPTEI